MRVRYKMLYISTHEVCLCEQAHAYIANVGFLTAASKEEREDIFRRINTFLNSERQKAYLQSYNLDPNRFNETIHPKWVKPA